jgi:hypothetical protein
MAAPDMAAPPAAGHRRNKSASVLKSIIASKGHKRSPTEGAPLHSNQVVASPYMPASSFQTPLLPPDHPHSQLRAANRTENIPLGPPSPRKPQDTRSSPKKSLHKKTLSSVSLRSLVTKDDKARDKQSSDAPSPQEEDHLGEKPKKTKSSTSLATMFGKGRSKDRESKHSPVKQARDKENTTPPSSATAMAPPRPPIWAEFSSQQEVSTTSKVPLNDRRRSIEEQIALYTPQNYSPSKQRNFFEYGQPALRPAQKERPKSMFVPKTSSTTSLLDTFSRKKSNERVPLGDTKGNEGRTREESPSKSKPSRPILSRASTDTSARDYSVKPMGPPPPASPTKKQNRVMAAVAAFNGKAKQVDGAATTSTKLDPKVVDAEFEVVLVRVLANGFQPPLTTTGISKHSHTPARSDANTEAGSQG